MGKVAIIQPFNGIALYSYGIGELVTDKIPDYDFFKKYKIKMNCVLINGIYIWGFQGIIITLEEYERIKAKALFLYESIPSEVIFPYAPSMFYGYQTVKNKKFIRNFTNTETLDSLRSLIFIKKIIEPFEANGIVEAKLKLNQMLKT